MNWILDNWYLVVAGVVLVYLAGRGMYDFFKMPRKKQFEMVKQWLLLAVIESEKQLGSGTGQLKLRLVYDWFVKRFPAIANVSSFETFSKWVDDALEQMQDVLKQNVAVQKYVRGDTDGADKTELGKSE